MNQTGPEGMWDEEDGFYYDVLRLPDGSSQRLKVRSMVGLLPLAATTVDRAVAAREGTRTAEDLGGTPAAYARTDRKYPSRPDLATSDMANAASLHW